MMAGISKTPGFLLCDHSPSLPLSLCPHLSLSCSLDKRIAGVGGLLQGSSNPASPFLQLQAWC